LSGQEGIDDNSRNFLRGKAVEIDEIVSLSAKSALAAPHP